MSTPLQSALFPAEAAPARATGSRSLQIIAPELVPAQQRFSKLLAKAQILTERLAGTRALADTFRPLYSSMLQPLQAQRKAGLRCMAVWLDAWLQKKNPGSALWRDTAAMLCSLSESLATDGDAEMQALHDRHSSMSWSDKKEAAAADRLASQPTPEAQQKAPDLPQNAQAALRAIYRQLASALHPDRALDATARVRQTELMGRVNMAYAARDLMALLTLQRHCKPPDAAAVSRLTAQKRAALTTLLKAQAAALDGEVAMALAQLRSEFALSDFTPVTVQGLTLALDEQAGALMNVTALIQQDLQRVKTDTGLKRWLKAQQKRSAPTPFPIEFPAVFQDFFR